MDKPSVLDMDKSSMLDYVRQLQEIRDNFNAETYFSELPIDHCRENFDRAMHGALMAVMDVYGELVMLDIQKRKEVGDVRKRKS